MGVPAKAKKRSFVRRAEQQGLVARELVERLAERRWRPKADSGNECLNLEEIEEYCTAGHLSADRHKHLDCCSECRGEVSASMPSTDRLERFLEEVKKHRVRVSA